MIFPIFPLNGAVLFPKTTLPLNIFEKRYLAMVDYAFANERIIGMIQRKESGSLFNIGCLGKIISFNETADGRYLISLEGTNCFKVKKELEKKHLFRMVDGKIFENKKHNKSFDNNDFKKKILENFNIYIQNNNFKLDIKELADLSLDQIIKFITMVSPFSYLEKQTCLETNNIEEFFDKLMSILEINSKNLEGNKVIN